MKKKIRNKHLEKLQRKKFSSRTHLIYDLLEVNRKMSKSNTNPDEYPMRYIMRVERNLSSSTK